MPAKNEWFTIACVNGHVKRVRRNQLHKYVAGRYVGSEFVPTATRGALVIPVAKCESCKKSGLS